MNSWYWKCWAGVVLPSAGKWEDAAIPAEEWWENRFGILPHCWRTLHVLPELSGDHPLALPESSSPCHAWRWTARFWGKSADESCCSIPPAPPQVPLHRLQRICFQLSSSWKEATPKWTMKSWQPRTMGFSPVSQSSEQRSFKASQWCPFLLSALPCPIHQWSNHWWNPRQGALKLSRYKIKIYRNMRSLAGFYDMHGAIPCPKPICYIYTPGLFIIPDTPPSVPHHAVAGGLVSWDSKDEITSSQ